MTGDFELKDKYNLSDAVDLVKLLRDPVKGCDWDKVQTHRSIRNNFIEEVYEACDCIDRDDSECLLEELGDVLLQVLLHAEIERQLGGFDIDEVSDYLIKKLIARHPHIFSDDVVENKEEVLVNWEKLKRREKGQKSGTDSIMDVPKAYPALIKSEKYQKRAAYVGFDYPGAEWAFSDLVSEVSELEERIETGAEKDGLEEEIGDVIFSAVNVARFYDIDAEHAAQKSAERFAERFRLVEKFAAEEGVELKTGDINRLNELWSKAKNALDCRNIK
ncbi:MAG: nucleoside triphosphate pyrophosphohydrolase [Ruminococcaceae bacterium]|nr:nucleoside triphosphate pyrophosphohydrolase [Oscillospiraceae bacterium]